MNTLADGRKTVPAQIVFTHDGSRKWQGRLLNAKEAIDTQERNRPVAMRPDRSVPRFDITEGDNGRFTVKMQGSRPGGRRYQTYATLSEAQHAGIRWAGRRFRIPVEPDCDVMDLRRDHNC